jgi:exopolysaccharide biosynthesis polyprenyl glycosylphosphotransferase
MRSLVSSLIGAVGGVRLPMALLSVAEAHFASQYRVQVPARRLLVVADGDDIGGLVDRIAANGNVKVVDVIGLHDVGALEKLAAQLAPQKLQRDRIWGIVIASRNQGGLPGMLAPSLLHCRIQGIRVLTETSFWEQQAHRIEIDEGDPSWFLGADGFHHSRLATLQKRLFDILVACALLIFALPLMLVVALLIRCDSRGPVFYRQERIGLGGRVFTLYKFRSMRQDAEADAQPKWAAIRDPRVTSVGRFIRYTRIDELPQLLNVLRGEMSIIGPRPERPYFVEKLAAVIPFYNARHLVKPGITGWAQVNASYTASIEGAREKLKYDLYYIKRRSFRLDMWIALRTLRVVFLQEGAR